MNGYRVFDGNTGKVKADISAKHGRDLFARFDGEWVAIDWPTDRAYKLKEGAVLETLGARVYFLTGDLITEAE